MTPWLPNLMPRLQRAWRDCLMIAVLLCCKGGAHAETESIVELPKVMVEGERPGPAATLPSLETARKRRERVPGGTDLIDAEIYRRGRASHLGDLLQGSPGVWVQPRFGADEARLSIRGSGLQRTNGLRGIKLLQDGVPIDHADGSVFFHALTLSRPAILRSTAAPTPSSMGPRPWVGPSTLSPPPATTRRP